MASFTTHNIHSFTFHVMHFYVNFISLPYHINHITEICYIFQFHCHHALPNSPQYSQLYISCHDLYAHFISLPYHINHNCNLLHLSVPLSSCPSKFSTIFTILHFMSWFLCSLYFPSLPHLSHPNCNLEWHSNIQFMTNFSKDSNFQTSSRTSISFVVQTLQALDLMDNTEPKL